MIKYETKDSGKREDFGNGSVRDTNEGKPRPDLISPVATLRHAELMARGAQKYGERNWEKGQWTSRFQESLERHLLLFKLGDTSEDHLAAIRYNVDAMMHFQGTEWDDISEVEKDPVSDSESLFFKWESKSDQFCLYYIVKGSKILVVNHKENRLEESETYRDIHQLINDDQVKYITREELPGYVKNSLQSETP